jgi:ribonuclease T2
VVPAASGSTWSIHGLWPSKNHGDGPFFCHGDAFDWNKVKSLESKLLSQWPNIVPREAEDDFWEYEWKKHGECAGSVALLNGEYNFFFHALLLNDKINVSSMLSKSNIVPSTTTKYTLDQFEKAVKDSTGKSAEIRCSKSKQTGDWYINAVRICVSKALEPIDCPRSDSVMGQLGSLPYVDPCPTSTGFYYPPVHSARMESKAIFGSYGAIFVNNIKNIIQWVL